MYCIGHTYDSTIGRSSTGSIIHPRVIDRILDHLRGELADSFSVLLRGEFADSFSILGLP
ncbi:hypothetical protein PGTUg99_003041 [Puccinia graminis f. sp. tritici]|uniref:Uncharacterized protein n=1 Tax=Puccinia graminis f. sp. tritici TaxID=56615 RepID=A0A5B0N6Q7_PUCGR|nr:hypothetical protein PGTUg99_001215 [Puccinia graminis f. sp. tritici]KAA1111239.1 hypothetical protein PGTUg99_003041 [Puccinia graminis f. sp. tritici]